MPALDWSKAGYVAFQVHNPGKEEAEFGVRVDDATNADGWNHSRQAMARIGAGGTEQFALALAIDKSKFGMNGFPGPTGYRVMGGSGAPAYDASHIVSMQFFMHQPAHEMTLVFDHLALLPGPDMKGIVDEFGQYAKATWPGKLTSASEFATRRTHEEAELQRLPRLGGRDQFGGLAGTKRTATGFFRTEKVDGRWWLVDPIGNLFFSNGCDVVNHYTSTFTTGRDDMFAKLPQGDDPLTKLFHNESTSHGGVHKEGRTFPFYEANLIRKYGEDWQQEFKTQALRRLPSWGFNTIGNWSDEALDNNGKVPYVVALGVWGDFAHLPSGNDYWGLMSDPFDPKFRAAAKASFARRAAACKSDPWCLGYFVDNELSWAGQGPENGRYGLAIGALGYPATSPAKQAFVTMLKEKYKTVEALNGAWQTTLASWDGLLQPQKSDWKFGDAQKADMAAFVSRLSAQYHQVVRDELKQIDPNHLYLGCRFAWYSRDAVRAAARYSDVLSLNIYAPKPNRADLDWLAELGKPVIIGEFHFGATDRGMFHPGLVDAKSQAGRAALYESYVREVAKTPYFVGCHWFQYIDEPLTGRVLDGENYQIGMVDVTDTPYPETISAARRVHGQVYELHRTAR